MPRQQLLMKYDLEQFSEVATAVRWGWIGLTEFFMYTYTQQTLGIETVLF